jgi:hypothetical protein
LVGDSDVISVFDGAFDAASLGLGGVDAGGALGGAVAVADLPAGLGVAGGGGWELDDPGHAVVSFGGSSELPEELEVLVPEEFRKSSGRDSITFISDWRET